MAEQGSMDKGARQGSIPPYVPYRTFINFLDGLKVGVPTHIDKSVMRSLSGGMQSWLKASLRFMKLIDQQGVPQQELFDLVHAEGEQRKQQLQELFRKTYSFMDNTIELVATTPAKLESAFVQTGATGETVKKCVAFMIAMAKDAGVELSPHVLSRAGGVRRPRLSRPRNGASTGAGATKIDTLGVPTLTAKTDPPDWADQLLSKFPNFDPAWPDDLKTKWFEGFERLMNARKL